MNLMPCKSCDERRQMAVTAYKSGGIKAVVKAAPAIASHLVRHRPVIIRKDKPNG
jgi:hypothetical protein